MNLKDYFVFMVGDVDDSELSEGHESEGAIIGQAVIDGLIAAHTEAPKGAPITLYISSEGGSVRFGTAIQGVINMLRRDGRKVIGHVIGYCFSSAFDILQHCDYRIAEREAAFMSHEETCKIEGSSGNAMVEAQFSKKMEKIQFQILSERTGRPVRFYQDKTVGQQWVLTPKEALAEGIIDEIIETPPLPKSKHQPSLVPKRRRKKDTDEISSASS